MPLKQFMQRFTREKDLMLFMQIAKVPRPNSIEDVPFYVLVPAFIIGELKTAFQIGFILYVPFLVVDLVVSSVLMSMGMMMLPPIMISLPLKLMLFVLVALIIAYPWLLEKLTSYTTRVFHSIPMVVR